MPKYSSFASGIFVNWVCMYGDFSSILLFAPGLEKSSLSGGASLSYEESSFMFSRPVYGMPDFYLGDDKSIFVFFIFDYSTSLGASFGS